MEDLSSGAKIIMNTDFKNIILVYIILIGKGSSKYMVSALVNSGFHSQSNLNKNFFCV